MIRVYVVCEGQTEETFVKKILYPYFQRRSTFLTPIIANRNKRGKGGVVSYSRTKSDIEKLCKQDSSSWVTTLFDFYAFPHPFVIDKAQSSFMQAQAIERAFQEDVAQHNFIAHLLIHEFEALLFSQPQAFGGWFDEQAVKKLESIRQEFNSPEDINNDISTAPSKRILRICNDYRKIFHGKEIASTIGLDRLRKECTLFDKWIKRIEVLAE